MEIDLQELADLKKRVEQLQRERAQAEGAQQQILKTLKQEFGCKDVKQAKARLKELEAEETRLEKEYERLKAEIQEELDGHLGDA